MHDLYRTWKSFWRQGEHSSPRLQRLHGEWGWFGEVPRPGFSGSWNALYGPKSITFGFPREMAFFAPMGHFEAFRGTGWTHTALVGFRKLSGDNWSTAQVIFGGFRWS